METRRIRLREVSLTDAPTLFEWRNTEHFRFLFHHDDSVVDYAAFLDDFARAPARRKFQFIIEKVGRQQPVGISFVHHFSLEEDHCFLNVYLSEPYTGRGYGVDVVALACHFLLRSVGISTVFLEAFAYNTLSLATLRKAGIPRVEDYHAGRLHLGVEHEILRFRIDRSFLGRIDQLLAALGHRR